METLLIVDDDLSLLESLKLHFEEPGDDRPGFHVATAINATGALQVAEQVHPALVILDMMLPDRTGLDIIAELRGICGDSPIIIVTAFHDMATTIRAMKLGAFDYLHKPFADPAALDLVIARALKVRQLARRAESATVEGSAARLGDIVGNSPSMQTLVKEIGKVSAAPRATVLITGESGSGKELIARVIHNYSHDEPQPFIGINCSAIVDTLLESELFGHEKGAFTGAVAVKQGKFEMAENGTVFLDEIGDMSLVLQAKLLRVLQEREFERVGGVRRIGLHARIIAATHRTLAEEVRAGRFREDLYQRLMVVQLEIPPLRERREDIPVLVHHLLARINEKVHKRVTRVAPEVMTQLCQLPWRGNVRELENVLTNAVVRSPGEVLVPDDLPSPGDRDGRSNDHWLRKEGWEGESFPTLDEAERVLIQRALQRSRGHKGHACELLGISRPTLERKLQKYGLAPAKTVESVDS